MPNNNTYNSKDNHLKPEPVCSKDNNRHSNQAGLQNALQKTKFPRSLKFSYRLKMPETVTCPTEQIPAVVLSAGPESKETISKFDELQDALQPFATTVCYSA